MAPGGKPLLIRPPAGKPPAGKSLKGTPRPIGKSLMGKPPGGKPLKGIGRPCKPPNPPAGPSSRIKGFPWIKPMQKTARIAIAIVAFICGRGLYSNTCQISAFL